MSFVPQMLLLFAPFTHLVVCIRQVTFCFVPATDEDNYIIANNIYEVLASEIH